MKTTKWIFAALIAGTLAIGAQTPVLVSAKADPATLPVLTGDDRTDPIPTPAPAPAPALAPQAVTAPAPPPASTWLSEQLPSWLYVGGQVRVRGEGFSGSSLVPGRNYQDAMTRIRLDLGIRFTSWLRVFGEGQDARVFNKNAQVSAEWKATGKLSFTTQFGDDRVATVGDSVYNGSGTALFHNYKATSNHLGDEIDVFAQYAVARALGVGAGYAHLFRGEYLTELSKGARRIRS
jgi:hypothetical protein